MSEDSDLIFPASIDLDGLDSDINEAVSMVGAFADTAASRLSGIRPPRVSLDLGGADGGGAAKGLASSIVPAAGLIAAGVSAGLHSLKSSVSGIGATISKQLDDAFRLEKAKDQFDSLRNVVRHDLESMRGSFDRFSKSSQASNQALHDKFLKQIKGMESGLRIHLLHSSASFLKGGLPSLDNFFQNESRTYKGGKRSDGGAKGGGPIASGLGSVGSALNPMRALRGLTDSTSASMLRLGFVAGGAFAVFSAGQSAFGFLKDGIKSASDLNETISKTERTLGTASGAVKVFADDMAERFGLVKGTTLDAAASLGGLGKSLGGLKGQKLAGFSTQFTKLAADLSSFSNIDLSTASQALQTGLAGNQSDTLRAIGVTYDQDAQKAYAYSHGIAKVGEELTEQQAFAARSAIILRGLSKVSGDLERTQGGAANQGRKLAGNITNLGTTIGQVFLPVVTEGIKLLNEFTSWGLKAFTDNRATIEAWGESILGTFDFVVASVHNFPAAFEVARLVIFEKLANIGEYLAVLGPNAVIVASYIARNWVSLLRDAFSATVTMLKNLWTNWLALGTAIGEWFADPTQGFKVNWTPLLDGFKSTAEKFPALLKPTLTDMSKQIAEAARPITDEVNKRRADRAEAKALGAPAIADLDVETDQAAKKKDGKNRRKEFRFGAALELGSKEAYSSVAQATSGRSKTDGIEQSGRETAGNTRELIRLQREANRKMGGNPGRLVIA